MMNHLVTSLSLEQISNYRWFKGGVLIGGLLVLLILYGQGILPMLFGLGILFLSSWLVGKKEFLKIHGAGKRIIVEGRKDTLRQLMTEIRNQVSKL